MLKRREFIGGAAAAAGLAAVGRPAHAQDVVRVGLIAPLSGDFQASVGLQMQNAALLYQSLNGATVAGKRVEIIIRDDAGNPANSPRIATEMIARDGVHVLAGMGLTPIAIGVAPIAAEAGVPLVIMLAATALLSAANTTTAVHQSPLVVRVSGTLPQNSLGVARWAPTAGVQRAMTLVSDYAPGIDAETSFRSAFAAAGGTVVGDPQRISLGTPDFSAALQRVADANPRPQALFVFVPAGQGPILMRQFQERGLPQLGVRLIGTGDMVDDSILNFLVGDVAIGTVTSHWYSADIQTPENQAFVGAYARATGGQRPNFVGVSAYDGMHLIYKALEATNGNTNGTALATAMRGQSWVSPRGPVSIDPVTRDIIQNIYVTRVARKADGQLWNEVFETLANVRDPVKAANLGVPVQVTP